MFDEAQLRKLNAPLWLEDVAQRKAFDEGGKTLDYVEGYYVIEKANEIFGFDGWGRQTTGLSLLKEYQYTGKKDEEMYGCAYAAKVEVTVFAGDGRKLIREGYGFGNGQVKLPHVGNAHELAIKEAETDAMKRAFVTFGDVFGLILYQKPVNGSRDEARLVSKRLSNAQARGERIYEQLVEAMHEHTAIEALDEWWANVKEDRAKLPQNWHKMLVEAASRFKTQIASLEAPE